MASGPAHDPYDRTQTAACLLLAAALLAFSAVYSAAAPLGRWENRIFGTGAWGEGDPGVWYVFISHQPVEQPPRYHGHPGTPLVLMLHGLQRAGFAWGGEPGATFSGFTARHLPDVLLASKLLTTFLHLLSFAALYAATRAIRGDPRAAFFATLGYASSLPVLYYLSRISPEPLMIGGFALSLLALWRYEERALDGGRGAALAWATLAGAAATTAAVGKVSLMGPLPFALAAALASDWPRRMGRAALPGGLRASACAAYATASLGLLAFYSQWVEWDVFFAYWGRLASSPGAALARLDPAALWPGLAAERLFPATEWLYLVLAAWGALHALRSDAAARPRLILLAGFAVLGLILFAYRALLAGSFLPFHYAIPLLAAAAPFFGHAVARLERRWLGAPRGPRALLAPVLLVACVHGLAVTAVVDSRRADARAYAPLAEAWEWVEGLAPGEQLVVESTRRPHLLRLHKKSIAEPLSQLTGWPAAGLLGIGGPPPRLQEAFTGLFRPSYGGMYPQAWPRLAVPALGITLIRPLEETDAGS